MVPGGMGEDRSAAGGALTIPTRFPAIFLHGFGAGDGDDLVAALKFNFNLALNSLVLKSKFCQMPGVIYSLIVMLPINTI